MLNDKDSVAHARLVGSLPGCVCPGALLPYAIPSIFPEGVRRKLWDRTAPRARMSCLSHVVSEAQEVEQYASELATGHVLDGGIAPKSPGCSDE
jgi:hypothetical protein